MLRMIKKKTNEMYANTNIIYLYIGKLLILVISNYTINYKSMILSISVILRWVIGFLFQTLTQVTNGVVLQEYYAVVYKSESVCGPIINF